MKRVIYGIILVFVIAMLIVSIFRKKELQMDETLPDVKPSTMVGKTYNEVLIKEVIVMENDVTVASGIYDYGDISRDGIIDSYDLKMLDLMINSGINSSEEHKILADLNQDGIVDKKDLDILTEYLKNKKELKYDTKAKEMSYAISENNNTNGLLWQRDNNFKLYDEKKYYAFAKYNDLVSHAYEFDYSYYNEDDE